MSHQRLVITPIDDADCNHGAQEAFPDIDPAAMRQQQRLSVMTEEA
ncbi:hypothetical protein [Burkholderia cenocepacia]|nr:hypothetical protein [Burkholderia cenocepacia]